MFHWYQNAAICYVYLTDVFVSSDSSETYGNFARSRWFTRGWTLQELLAPADAIFYSADWKSLGKKSELLDLVSTITGIEEVFLQGRELEYASISKRMSWAAKRNTSRVEDIAYCLLGIFDINMPLIYGEGKKAFQRLQQELMKTNPYDDTLYAWGVVVDKPSSRIDDVGDLPPWNQANSRSRLLGPLAESPRDFEFSGSFFPNPMTRNFYHSSQIGRPKLPNSLGLAVQFELVSYRYSSVYQWTQVKITQGRGLLIAVLFCLSAKNHLPIGIPLQRWGEFSWGRTSEIILHDLTYFSSTSANQITMINVEAERPVLLKNGDIIFRRLEFSDDLKPPIPAVGKIVSWTHGANLASGVSIEEPFFFQFQLKNPGDSHLRSVGVAFSRLPVGLH